MKLHVTLAHPVRLMLQGRSSQIVALDGELEKGDDDNRLWTKFTTSAVYPSSADKSSPTPVKIKTTLYLHQRFVVGAWPLPEG